MHHCILTKQESTIHLQISTVAKHCKVMAAGERKKIVKSYNQMAATAFNSTRAANH